MVGTPSYANAGLAAILAASKKGCCDGCDEAKAHGVSAPCCGGDIAHERAMLVAGVTDELETAKWFLDNRWPIIGASFAIGGVFFATVSYFVNRNP